MEEIDVVIVGGGISGLATSLALHRKGLKSVVLERAESLRTDGAGIGVLTNGWRALNQLGVADKLRHDAALIQMARNIWEEKGKRKETVSPLSVGEARYVRRSDLTNALADDLPNDTIRFGCRTVSVKLDSATSDPILELDDGRKIKAKAVIGCDGANSVVAEYLGLKPKKLFTCCAVRGFTNYPDGHGFPIEFLRFRRDNVVFGRIPITEELVFWFLVRRGYPDDPEVAKEPKLVAEMALETVEGYPEELKQIVKNCDLTSLSFSHLRYRSPWELLTGKFRRDTVTVAGDAMHVMGPFLGQGGSAGIEDAIVLARCVARKLGEYSNRIDKTRIRDAFAEYVGERRMRVVRLSTQTYLTGYFLMEASSAFAKMIVVALMAVLFSDPIGHTRHDCGLL